MTWLSANYGNIIVIALVALLLAICFKAVFGSKKNCCEGCNSGCAGCSLCKSAAIEEMRRQGVKF